MYLVPVRAGSYSCILGSLRRLVVTLAHAKHNNRQMRVAVHCSSGAQAASTGCALPARRMGMGAGSWCAASSK
eukprot:scaffold4543_cov126-Isochrysis_galbana.AAC.13